MSKSLPNKSNSLNISWASLHTAVLFLPVALTLVLTLCIYSTPNSLKPKSQSHAAQGKAVRADHPALDAKQSSGSVRPAIASDNHLDRDPTWRRTPKGWQQVDEPELIEKVRYEKRGEVTRWSKNPTVAILQSAWPPAAAVFIAFASYSLLNSWPTECTPTAKLA